VLRTTSVINVGVNTAGGTRGFEFLFCNIAWTGFRLGSNGNIVFRDSDISAATDPALVDFTPTVPEFLAGPPQIAGLYTDLNPNDGGQFSVSRIGFADVDAFIIQYINYPQRLQGGVGVNIDAEGVLGRGNTNSFDITLYDDQDAWDDCDAEFVQDTTDIRNGQAGIGCVQGFADGTFVDNDGISFPSAVGLQNSTQDGGVTRIIDRNGDGDVTDENLVETAQEGVGRTIPEQGPFKLTYHQVEVIGTAANPVIVGYSTGFDPSFNIGTIPPGLCETNLSRATPAEDNPFFMSGALGMGTEPSLYEFFNGARQAVLNPDGTVTTPLVDFDLRQEVLAECAGRAERFIDTTSAECLLFKGANQPVGLFCQSLTAPATGNTDPFLGPVTFTVNGFNFPMPANGQNAICSQFCGTTTPAFCRNGKTVTCSATIAFDENGDGIIDSTVTLTEATAPIGRIRTVNENQILIEGLNLATSEICGGAATVTIACVFGFGDDNKFFELRADGPDAGTLPDVGPVTLVCSSASTLFGLRQPVVLSIAPDTDDCTNPDDPDRVEDVQINGICFGTITSAFLTTTPNGSGTRVPISNVVNVTRNTVTGTIRFADLTPNTPYYVFVIRNDGAVSTGYPNTFGFDVTFTCTTTPPPPPVNVPHLTSCRVKRVAGGKFVLEVNGSNFLVNNSVVLLNNTPCRTNKYPSGFIGQDGKTTRINCTGGIKKLLPATVTVRNQDGTVSDNSLQCNF